MKGLRMMTQHQFERRLRPRFSVSLPVELIPTAQGNPVSGIASNISVSGIYFFVSRGTGIDSDIQFIVTFPPEFTLANSVKVKCQAKVVRLDPEASRGLGVAASIHRYEFLDRGDNSYPFAAMTAQPPN
jgi:hypothetical protein